MVEQTYPSGKVVRNFFENDGDLAKVVRNGKTYVSDFSYNASGGINSLKLGNGRWETAQFNSRQQLTQLGLGATANDSSLFKLQYEFGETVANGTIQNTGNITKQTITLPNASFVQTYKYDALDRLTEAKETNGTSATENWKQTFGYDRFGNRTGFSQQINNQELAINSQTLPSVNPDTNRFNLNQGFEYDKSGNVIKDIDRVTGLQRSFTFNAENKQVHVKDANNAPVGTYYYDGNGLRVKKTTATETTIFVYDGSGKMVAEYSTQQSANPTVSYLTTDHLGTPRVITDKNGNVISRRDFLPFGEEIGVNTAQTLGRSSNPQYGASDNVRQKFTGYEKDNETNLDFADARYYDGKFGRFTAVDPLLASGKSTDPQTFNRYTYALNSPLLMIDSTGEKPVYVSGQKGHQKYTDYYVKGSTKYEGGRIKVFGSANGGKNAWYIITRNGIFSANSKTQLNDAVGGGSGSQAAKPKPKPSQGSDALPAGNRQIFGKVADNAKQQALSAGVAGLTIGAGVACWYICGPVLAAGGTGAVAVGTHGTAGPVIGLGLGLGAGVAAAKLIPTDGIINIGGLSEGGGGTKVNIETPREPIENLVYGNAQNIGEMFEPNSAIRISANRFPTSGIQDWNQFGQGAYTVLQSGGEVDLFVSVTGDSYTSVVNGLNNAGFQNVTATPIGDPNRAWIYHITGAKPQ